MNEQNDTNVNQTEDTSHPAKIAGVGSKIRFQPSGNSGKGKLGIIKSLKKSGITVTVTSKGEGKNGKDKETDFLIQPSQVTKFYKEDEQD